MRAALALLFFALLAGGCTSMSPRVSFEDERPQPVPIPLPQGMPSEGAIFSDGQSIALFEDAKARNVGDLVTILLVERTQAQKSAETSTNKSSSVDVTDVTLFGKSVGVNTGVSGSRSATGGGESTQSNRLDGSVTAVVVARLPNGLLQVRGEKQITLNQGSEMVFIDGVVRPIDILSNNTISSDRVANARVSYKGRGALADANAQGWLTRFFNSPWFPF
ncbi:flagellar basal body L-ring protein FlgH [Nevskia sp.]|uniref:flagellar basal body L-ring protein FlgH n=1 Tax=Nevskia sp. TaxID=1929292 RepID=UPI0025F7624C|nr:flagellar basal body L-ring protein FlgH [Nevskia sp.]